MRIIFTLVFCALFTALSAQNQRITFMTYNLMYFRASSKPCTHTLTPSQRTAHLKTILDFAKPDILLVNELGSTPTNGDFILLNVFNAGSEANFDKASFSGNGSGIVNMLFFDTTQVGLFAQDRIEEDLSGNDLVRNIDVYTLFYKDPKLSIGADTTYLTIVGAHLKAGTSTPDQFERKEAADAVMAYLSTRYNSQNLILAGDLNVYRNTEPAYQSFTAFSDTSVRFYDPINQPGNWNNNVNFSGIHTQSTHSSSSGCFSGGGGDDRFDFILTSNVLLQGSKGITYVPNSYNTLGQDGNHFNQSINNGNNSSAPSNIINALYNLSDHLPVYARFDFKSSDIGLSESNALLSIRFNNPVKDLLFIDLGPVERKVAIEVIDLSGKTVFKTSAKAGGRQRLELNCSNWHNGLYLIRFSDTKGNIITRKFIKN